MSDIHDFHKRMQSGPDLVDLFPPSERRSSEIADNTEDIIKLLEESSETSNKALKVSYCGLAGTAIAAAAAIISVILQLIK